MRTITRGDSYLWTIQVTQNGEAFNLTEFFALMTIKKTKDSETGIEIKPSIISGGENNTIEIKLSSDITKDLTPGTYVFDVQINNTQTPPIVKTILTDTLVVEDDITKNTRTSE
jgi:hypothetical protein